MVDGLEWGPVDPTSKKKVYTECLGVMQGVTNSVTMHACHGPHVSSPLKMGPYEDFRVRILQGVCCHWCQGVTFLCTVHTLDSPWRRK
jgi:hypothetical protein